MLGDSILNGLLSANLPQLFHDAQGSGKDPEDKDAVPVSKGDLTVTSDVPGARISLDGHTDPQWVTPYTFHDLPKRFYMLAVSKNGYESDMHSVKVVPGSGVSFSARLQPSTGEITISTNPPGLDVFIDDKTYGPSPARAESFLASQRKLPAMPQSFIVSSSLVWRLHGTQLARSVRDAEPILVPDGERFKQLPTVARIYDALVRANADRAATLITFGGGVIGDMAGFAAATYLRGVALAHVPTTLLAQVDSAIGGKVGVNHALGKNLIGAFYQPHAVVVDPSVLATLPRREFRAGLYEVIKYGMTSSPSLFDRIARESTAIFGKDPRALTEVIAESCRIKAGVVSADEQEAGPRRILNFGHTAGHALEAVTKYRRYRHGEAVAYGMLVAAELASGRGALADLDKKALADLIASLGPLPPVADLAKADILDVRHWTSYAESHIQGARSMPLRTVAERATEISKTSLAVFY